MQAVKLTRWLRAADTAARLSGPQASALAIIVHAERIRPSELAELEEVKRPTIARTIRQLSDLGLIKRKVDSSDARSAFLIATQKGKTLLEEGQKRRIEPLARAFMGLSPGERLTLEKAARIVEGILP
ncbi:MAG: MarR family transcriptional regulator [Planctomycetota bacterium]